jgi:hypothetical protein
MDVPQGIAMITDALFTSPILNSDDVGVNSAAGGSAPSR